MPNKITLSYVKSPFSPGEKITKCMDFIPGTNVCYYLDAVKSIPDVNWVVSVTDSFGKSDWKGDLLNTEDWPIVKPGDFITVVPILGDAKIFGVILMVAVVIFASWASPYIANMMAYYGAAGGIMEAIGLGAMTSSIIGAGIITAGAMLVNSVLPINAPDVPQIAAGQDPFKESPTYGWGDLRATEGQGNIIPILFGKMRVSGQIISKFITLSGDKQYVNLLIGVADTVGIDEIAITNIEINDQPIDNFHGITVYTKSGSLTDDVIPGFDNIIAQVDQGSKITQSGVQRSTNGNEVEKIELDLIAPYGMYYSNDQGGLDNRVVNLEIYLKLTTASTFVYYSTKSIAGATNQAVRTTVSIDGLSSGQWDYKIVRVEDESTDNREKTDVYLAAHREIVKQNLTYPGLAKLAITAVATDQLSGGLPAISFLAERTYVQVYNPHTDEWLAKRADNPAWAYYGFWVTHMGVDPSRMLYDEISTWADYCEEVLYPEEGGVDSRYVLGLYLDVQTNAWANAQQICRVGRAQPIRRGSKYGVVVDMPTLATQVFGIGNTSNFKLTYLSSIDRANAVEVSYYDEDLNFTKQTLTVLSSEYDTSVMEDNKTSKNAYGTTNRNQVIRGAVADLNSNKALIRSISFDVDICSLSLQVGDVFYFAHDAPNWAVSGRIVSVTTTTVTLDKEVGLSPGGLYSILIIRSSDDVILEKSIEGVSEYTDTITLTFESPIDAEDLPAKYDVFTFGETSQYKKMFRCTGVSREHDLKKTVTGLEYSDLISLDTQYVLDSPDTVKHKALAYGVDAKEYLTTTKDGNVTSQISVSWLASSTDISQSWEVWVEDMTSLTGAKGPFFAQGLTYVINPSLLVIGHDYKIIVMASGKGLLDTGDNSAIVTIDGKSDGPPNVSSFLIDVQADGTRQFSWAMAYRPPDLAGFRIKYKLGNSGAWDDLTDLASGLLVASPYETNALDAGEYIFGIKAYDWSGNESVDMLSVIAELTDPRLGQALYSTNAAPLWAGTLTDCHEENGIIVANDGASTTWSDAPSTWSAWESYYLNPLTEFSYEHPPIDLGTTLRVTMRVSSVGTGTVSSEMSGSDDNSTWTDWVAIGQIVARYIKVKVTVSETVTPPPQLSSLTIIASGEVKTEQLNDLSTSGLSGTYRVAAGHIYLPLVTTFNVVTQVMLSLQNIGPGWTWEIIDKAHTVSGKLAPEIKIYNASGVLADALIDAYIRGV